MAGDASSDPPDSQRLLAQYAAGEDQALAALLTRHLGPLRAFVRLQIGAALRARETESDIVQNVCVEALQRAGTFEFQGEAAFRGWLYRAVTNVIRDKERYYRADRRAPAHELPAANAEALLALYSTLTSPSGAAAAREDVARIEDAFTRLPARYSEVLALTHIAGQTRGEIAATMGISADAVSKLQRRATLRLARELGHA